jgi:hypothetical protein
MNVRWHSWKQIRARRFANKNPEERFVSTGIFHKSH